MHTIIHRRSWASAGSAPKRPRQVADGLGPAGKAPRLRLLEVPGSLRFRFTRASRT